MVVGFLVKQLRWPLLRALRHVHERRPIVLTNESFRLQLIRLAAREGLLLEEHEEASPPPPRGRCRVS